MKSNYLKMYNMHFRDLTNFQNWGLLKNSQKNKAITENLVIVL